MEMMHAMMSWRHDDLFYAHEYDALRRYDDAAGQMRQGMMQQDKPGMMGLT